MKIVVFGANGPTGRLVTRQALAQGHTVTAVTRHPQGFPIRHDRLQVVQADVYDDAAVEQAVAGQDAVLSTLGVPFSRKPITVYSQGARHIMQAMQHYGVRRLVGVTSSVTAEPHDTGGGFFFEKLVKPFVTHVLGRTLYEDMRHMQALVLQSQLDWTIIRPSGLFDTPAVTRYQVAEDHIRGTFTSRPDLADCMLQQRSRHHSAEMLTRYEQDRDQALSRPERNATVIMMTRVPLYWIREAAFLDDPMEAVLSRERHLGVAPWLIQQAADLIRIGPSAAWPGCCSTSPVG